MVKTAYIIASIALVALLAIAGIAVYLKWDVAGNFVPTHTPDAGHASNVSSGQVTALQAVATADKDAGVRAWKARVKNASLAQVSSDFCEGGLSDTWELLYASDTDEATVRVSSSTVDNISMIMMPERLYPFQNIAVANLIDSDKACNLANLVIANASMAVEGPASAELTLQAPGVSTWDLSYPIARGYYIIRMDASSGRIKESTVFSG